MSGDPHEHGNHPLKGLLRTTRYGVTHGGHDVELEFDRRNPLLNAARLLVDGEVVDKKRLLYGEKDLTTTAEDGTEIVVAVDSGMNGELTRPASWRGRLLDRPGRARPAVLTDSFRHVPRSRGLKGPPS